MRPTRACPFTRESCTSVRTCAGIPRSPHEVSRPAMTVVDQQWEEYQLHVVPDDSRGPTATHGGQCVDGYMHWFRQISHPYLIPGSEVEPPAVAPRDEDITLPESSSASEHSSAVVSAYVGEFVMLLFTYQEYC